MRYKLGQFIEIVDVRNSDDFYSADSVRGLSSSKKIIKTKANVDGLKLTNYKLFTSNSFAYVPDTSRRGDKMSLAYNNTQQTFLVSSISIVFKINASNNLNSDYLYMFFNRPEFDRFARYNSWGSARETFSWEDMCDIEIDLPPLEIQEKYVAVYNSMLSNQKSYEKGLDDLKLTCDAYVEHLQHDTKHESIEKYIRLAETKNIQKKYGECSVKGISIEKCFIETRANMKGISLNQYYVVPPNAFAYAPVTSRNGGKISIAHNNTGKTIICSSSYIVFEINNMDKLLPGYLQIFFNRSEFNRYARFHSWGSARETFTWDDFCEVTIPIPSIDIQRAIVGIYNAYTTRREINEKLKEQIKDLCPILIAGSVREATANAEI